MRTRKLLYSIIKQEITENFTQQYSICVLNERKVKKVGES